MKKKEKSEVLAAAFCVKMAVAGLIAVVLHELIPAEAETCVVHYDQGGSRVFNCERGDYCCGEFCCSPKIRWWSIVSGFLCILTFGVGSFALYRICCTSNRVVVIRPRTTRGSRPRPIQGFVVRPDYTIAPPPRYNDLSRRDIPPPPYPGQLEDAENSFKSDEEGEKEEEEPESSSQENCSNDHSVDWHKTQMEQPMKDTDAEKETRNNDFPQDLDQPPSPSIQKETITESGEPIDGDQEISANQAVTVAKSVEPAADLTSSETTPQFDNWATTRSREDMTGSTDKPNRSLEEEMIFEDIEDAVEEADSHNVHDSVDEVPADSSKLDFWTQNLS